MQDLHETLPNWLSARFFFFERHRSVSCVYVLGLLDILYLVETLKKLVSRESTMSDIETFSTSYWSIKSDILIDHVSSSLMYRIFSCQIVILFWLTYLLWVSYHQSSILFWTSCQWPICRSLSLNSVMKSYLTTMSYCSEIRYWHVVLRNIWYLFLIIWFLI